jgi:hypothetical protein
LAVFTHATAYLIAHSSFGIHPASEKHMFNAQQNRPSKSFRLGGA